MASTNLCSCAVANPEVAEALLGPACNAQQWWTRWEGDWNVFSESHDSCRRGLQAPDDVIEMWHGTCLSQARNIYQVGFVTGPGTHDRSTGLWGLYSRSGSIEYPRGHAMERAVLERGWLEPPFPGSEESWVNGWTCPVVIRLRIPRSQLRVDFRVEVGTPPCSLACLPRDPWVVIPLQGRFGFEMHVHQPTYDRYNKLHGRFAELRGGGHATHVLCQAELGRPETVLNPKHQVSCGRVVSTETARRSWRRTGSKLWRCPVCSAAHEACQPMASYE